MTVVFADDFETNDFSLWPDTVTTGTSLNITIGASLEGTYGLEFDVEPSSSDELRNESLTVGGTTQRFGFRLDFNDLSLDTAEVIDELFRMNDAGGDIQMKILLVEDTGIKVRVIAYDAAFATYTVTSAAQSGEITVEVKVTDTVVELFIDGSSVGTDTAASGLSLSNVEVLILNGGGGGVNTGSFFIDDIQFENTDTVLFPPASATWNLIPSGSGLRRYTGATSQDGEYLFFALEDADTGNQIIARIPRPDPASAIGASTAVYKPGGGSAGNVLMDPHNPDKMFFFGNFGTDIGLLLHTISTGGETDISPASIGADLLQPVEVDPLDDAHLVAINRNDADALETFDSGDNWTTLNAALGITVDAMGLLWVHPSLPIGGFIGGNDGADTNLSYTPNAFGNLREDSNATMDASSGITSIDVVRASG